MRKTLLISFICFALYATAGARQLRTPQPSSTTTIKQNFGLGSIELNYSRPGIKGRKVFGDLVPFGKVWRTGANNATVVTFSDEVTIGGTKVPAGKYGLLTIPDKDKWTIIVTKATDVTSPADYKQESDVVRVDVKPTALGKSVETFTMQFTDVKNTSIALNISWDKTAVSLPITTDIDGKVMAQIDAAMKSDNAEKPYFPAAMYYMETGKDLNQALTWLDKAVEKDANAFWVWHQRANVLAKLGKKKDAVESANKSIELAKVAKNADYVALNEKLLATLK